MAAEGRGGFALTVQCLPMDQQVLVIGELAGAQRGDGWFNAEEVLGLFESLRLPPPHQVNQSLGRLRSGKLVVHRVLDDRRSLTPLGRAKVLEAVEDLVPAQLSAEYVSVPGAEFAHARHLVVPPTLAPARWAPAIARLLEAFPFETNVFLMTRFPAEGADEFVDPVADVIPVLRDVSSKHGMTLHTASDRQIEDDLWGNVGGYIWACRYGIGLLETSGPRSDELNDNVLIELGSMLTIGRRCMMLRDENAPRPPTDLVAQIYKRTDFDDHSAVAKIAHRWFADDLGLGQCADCPPRQ